MWYMKLAEKPANDTEAPGRTAEECKADQGMLDRIHLWIQARYENNDSDRALVDIAARSGWDLTDLLAKNFTGNGHALRVLYELESNLNSDSQAEVDAARNTLRLYYEWTLED